MNGGALSIGDRIFFDDDEHTVIGMVGSLVRLRSDTGVGQLILVTELIATADFKLLGRESPPPATAGEEKLDRTASLDSISEDHRKRALTLEAHLLELTTGHRSENPDEWTEDEPRAEYDPSRPLKDRVANKAAELGISDRQLWRWHARWSEQGLWGLVDRRRAKTSNVLAGIDPHIVTAILEQGKAEARQSTGTQQRFYRRVQTRLDDICAKEKLDPIALPPKSTFHRYTQQLLSGLHTFGDATTRQTMANKPTGTFSVMMANRPGELVLMDSTRLDILVVDPAGGEAVSAELSASIDLATRSLLSWRFTPVGTNSADAALLLADAVTPEVMREGWRESLRYSMLKVPYERLLDFDERLRSAAARPLIVPETVVVDNGSIYISRTFLDGCRKLGINLQLGRKGQPTDKAQVERMFGSLRTLFAEHVAGYKGRNVAQRARHVEKQTAFTIEELEELFAEFVVAVWQRRRHDGLVLPGFPEVRLSPNDAYAEAVNRCGAVSMPANPMLYIELLPVEWRRIHPFGIKIGGLVYDDDVLGDYRRGKSEHAAMNGKWPIHRDPRDASHVYFQDPTDSNWHSVPWTHMPEEARPFSDVTAEWVKQTLSERGRNPADQEEVAEALLELQTRTDLSSKDRRKRRAGFRDTERARHADRDRDRAGLERKQPKPAPHVVPDIDEDDDFDLSSIQSLPSIDPYTELT